MQKKKIVRRRFRVRTHDGTCPCDLSLWLVHWSPSVSTAHFRQKCSRRDKNLFATTISSVEFKIRGTGPGDLFHKLCLVLSCEVFAWVIKVPACDQMEIFYFFASWPGQILYLPVLGDLDRTVAGISNLVGHSRKRLSKLQMTITRWRIDEKRTVLLSRTSEAIFSFQIVRFIPDAVETWKIVGKCRYIFFSIKLTSFFAT